MSPTAAPQIRPPARWPWWPARSPQNRAAGACSSSTLGAGAHTGVGVHDVRRPALAHRLVRLAHRPAGLFVVLFLLDRHRLHARRLRFLAPRPSATLVASRGWAITSTAASQAPAPPSSSPSTTRTSPASLKACAPPTNRSSKPASSSGSTSSSSATRPTARQMGRGGAALVRPGPGPRRAGPHLLSPPAEQ